MSKPALAEHKIPAGIREALGRLKKVWMLHSGYAMFSTLGFTPVPTRTQGQVKRVPTKKTRSESKKSGRNRTHHGGVS